MRIILSLLLVIVFLPFLPTRGGYVEIKAIVFDCGGVLTVIDRSPLYEYLEETLHINEEEQRALFKSLKTYYGDGGDERAFFTQFANSRGIQLTESWFEKLEEVKIKLFKEVPGMLELVRQLQIQGYKTTMLSNITAYQAQVVRKLGYYDLFTPVILSYEIGVNKPDPNAYLILLDRLELTSKEILFIDDKTENIDSAKSLGIDSILFENPKQLVQELRKRNITL